MNVSSTLLSAVATGAYWIQGKQIAYCFHSVPNNQKIGSYTGTGASGNFIETGFEPAFVLAKSSSGTGSWLIMDNKRGADSQLYPNLPAAEYNDSDNYFYSNGFEMKSNGNWNTSGETFIYLAIAADAQPAPVLANSFQPVIYTGNGGTQNIDVDFKPDFTWIKNRDYSGGISHFLADSIRGGQQKLSSNTAGGEVNLIPYGDGVMSFNNNGFTVADDPNGDNGINGQVGGTYGSSYVSWNWKAAGISTINNKGTIPSITNANPEAGFSIVKYTKSGTTGTMGHGLDSIPELILEKRTDGSAYWNARVAGITSNNQTIFLNEPTGVSTHPTLDLWTTPTTSVFGYTGNNATAGDYIAYCFHSVPNYQKIGSYSGNGSSGGQTITGLGFNPRFLLVKNTTSSASWRITDSARGDNIYLYPNLPSGDDSSSGYISLITDGFRMNGLDSNTSDTFMYLAIA